MQTQTRTVTSRRIAWLLPATTLAACLGLGPLALGQATIPTEQPDQLEQESPSGPAYEEGMTDESGMEHRGADAKSHAVSGPAHKDFSQFVGTDVIGSDGEPIGEVEDAVIDHASGKIDFLVINHDAGVLDLTGTSYAVPYSSVTAEQEFSEPAAPAEAPPPAGVGIEDQSTPDIASADQAHEKRLILRVDRTAADLEAMPEFNAGEWGNIDQETWAESVDRAWSSVAGEGEGEPDASQEPGMADEAGAGAAGKYVLGSDIDDVQVMLVDNTESDLDGVIVDAGEGVLAFLSVNDDQGTPRLVRFDQIQTLDAQTAALTIGQSELRALPQRPEDLSSLDGGSLPQEGAVWPESDIDSQPPSEEPLEAPRNDGM